MPYIGIVAIFLSQPSGILYVTQSNIVGAADLGNQKTILVLDVGGLMSEALRGDSNVNV